MKGQINLEFVSSGALYLIAIGLLFTVGSGALPSLGENVDKASLYLDARQMTTQLLMTPGHQSFSEADNWEKNETTVENTVAVGLASDFMEIDRQKLEKIKSFDSPGGTEYLDYQDFKEVTGSKTQYRFNFTRLPIVETEKSFTRCSPPPKITEPVSCDGLIDTYYERAGNDIHYGAENLFGTNYKFLVTSHDGDFNTTYISDDWDFSDNNDPWGENDRPPILPSDTRVESFQNREEEPGSMLVLGRHLKTFGANVDSDSQVIGFYRYAVMEGEPIRVRVLAW